MSERYGINPDLCTNCGACVEACPVGAISEQNETYVINHELCNNCGDCEPVCPVEAISTRYGWGI